MSDRPLKKYRVKWVIGDAYRDLAEGDWELEAIDAENAATDAQYEIAESFDSADTYSKRVKPEQVHILEVEEIE